MSEIKKHKVSSVRYSTDWVWAEFEGGGFLIGGNHYGPWKSNIMLRAEVEELVELLQNILDDTK